MVENFLLLTKNTNKPQALLTSKEASKTNGCCINKRMFEVQPTFDLAATETHGGDGTQDGSLVIKGWEILLEDLLKLCLLLDPVQRYWLKCWSLCDGQLPPLFLLAWECSNLREGKRLDGRGQVSLRSHPWLYFIRVNGHPNSRGPSESSCKLLLPHFLALCGRKLKQLSIATVSHPTPRKENRCL